MAELHPKEPRVERPVGPVAEDHKGHPERALEDYALPCYLINTFLPGMTWGSYGYMSGEQEHER